MFRRNGSAGPSAVSRTLAADRLGVWTVFSIVAGAMAPMTVVLGGATTGWLIAAVVAIPLAYLVIGVLLMLFSSGYTALSQRLVSPGPLYTFPVHGLGQIIGVGSGSIALPAYFTMDVGLLGGFGITASTWLKTGAGISVPWWAFCLVGAIVAAIIWSLHVEWLGKVLAVLLLAEVAVTIVLAVVLFAHPAGGQVSFTAINPNQIGVAGFGAALAIAIAGFAGFEATGNMAEESRNPRRTVLLATFIAVGIIMVVYAGSALSMVVAAGPDQIIARASGDGTDTMFNLAGPFVASWLITVGRLLLLSSLFAGYLAFGPIWARYAFTMSREGVLPAVLSRTSTRTQAPVVASWTITGLNVLVIGVYAFNHWDPLTKLFFWQTVIGGFGILVMLVIASAAAAVYFTRRRHRIGVGYIRGVIAPALSVVALGWVVVLTLQQFHELLGVEPTSPLRWLFPALFGAAFVIGALWALWLRAANRAVYDAIGTNAAPSPPADETPTATHSSAGPGIRRATPDDLDTVTTVLAGAFQDGDYASWLVPDPHQRARIYPPYFRILAEHALTHGWVDITTTGDGVAVWHLVGYDAHPPIPWYQRRLAAAVGQEALPRFQAMDTIMGDAHPSRPHHHLALLAVLPSSRHQGIAETLLRRHEQYLDDRGIPGYLEATGKALVEFYRRHGYHLRQTVPLAIGGPSMYQMWRYPITASGSQMPADNGGDAVGGWPADSGWPAGSGWPADGGWPPVPRSGHGSQRLG